MNCQNINKKPLNEFEFNSLKGFANYRIAFVHLIDELSSINIDKMDRLPLRQLSHHEHHVYSNLHTEVLMVVYHE